jgi:hypothetical protein
MTVELTEQIFKKKPPLHYKVWAEESPGGPKTRIQVQNGSVIINFGIIITQNHQTDFSW